MTVRQWLNRTVLLVALLMLASPALAQTVPQAELEALYGASYPGVGVRTTALVGPYIKSATVTSGTLTLVLQDTTSASQRALTYTGSGGGGGSSDGVLDSASFDTTSQVIELGTSTGVDFTVDLSNLTSIAEVNTAISTGTSGFLTQADIETLIEDNALQPADFTAGSNITLTTTTDGLTITAASGGGGGGTDLTFAQFSDPNSTDTGLVSGSHFIRALLANGDNVSLSLSQADVEDETDTDYGTVSGQRLAQSIEANVGSRIDDVEDETAANLSDLNRLLFERNQVAFDRFFATAPDTAYDSSTFTFNSTARTISTTDADWSNATRTPYWVDVHVRSNPDQSPTTYTVTADRGAVQTVTAGDIDSESATNAFVMTADGSGGAAWAAVTGSGGGLTAVTSDATLDGAGTAGDPIGVADEGVDTAQLAGNAVTQAKLAANSVHGAQIANSVVGTSELEDDAVTEAKVADSAIGNEQLAANSVRVSEIQANAVTHVKMADGSVDTLELQDGAATVAKMDSGTATDGHVATADGSGGVAFEAVPGGGGGGVSTFIALTDTPAAITADECVQGNTAGDALVFAACATGGGGTTVTANPGSGTTDLTTVTIGATDYTIAPSATAVTAFECVMTDVAAATYSAVTNILECDGTPTINEGMFVVEDASGTDTTDRVVIQAAGFYELIVSLHINSIASTLRTVALVSFQLERGGTDTVLADQGTEYVRDGVEAASVYHTSLVELEVDDRIGVVLQSEASSASIGIDGSKSYFAIVKAGGPEGPRGPAGTGSDIASVDVSYAPDVRVWELTIEQTGGGATFTESTTIPIATQATFGLIEMANGPEVEAGSAINRALAPSTIQFLNPNQMASGNAASDGDVATADGAGRITWETPSGGGGTGDITAVTTANNSGLAGGADSGDADLSLHANNLPTVTSIATGDHLVVADASDSNATKRITVNNFGPHLAGTGLDATSTGQLVLDLNEPAATTTIAGTDVLVLGDASDSFETKRTTMASIASHLAGTNLTASADGVLSASGGGGGGTTVAANPDTDGSDTDLESVTIDSTDYNISDIVIRDLVGYSGRQELHPRIPLPVEQLTGNHNLRIRSLGYDGGELYGFVSNASGGSVNGTDLLNSRDPQDGGTVARTSETNPVLVYFFLNGTTLYGQNIDGGGETTFNTTTIRAGVPYALSNDPDENGKLYLLIDSGNDVYVEELDFNSAPTVTHSETVATITPTILNTFASFGGYDDETDTATDTGSSGGDAAGLTDIYVGGDFAWFLVTYAEDSNSNSDHNYIARFARTDSAITAPATVADADLIQIGFSANTNQNSLIALATEAGVLTDVFISRASDAIIDHLTNSRLGDYADLANLPPELSQANVEDATSEIFGLISGERLEEHTLDAVPDVPVYFDGNMHGNPFDPNDPLGPNVVEFESDSHLNIQYRTDASTTNTNTQEIKGDIYSSGDRTFHITSVDVASGYVLNRTYHVYLAFVDTANSDQVTATYPSSTRYHAPSNGRPGVFTHQYTWGSVGIEIPPNTDFYLGLAPVDNQGSTVIRSGAMASNSPVESNADNSDDITYVSPATRSGFALHVNNTLTRPANGFVLGNFKIYYHTTLGGIASQAEILVRNAGTNVDVDNANEAVDGINFEGGLEAVRDDSNPNIPIVRIEDLGVSTDKIAGDAVTNAKLADLAVADANLNADLSERICPDPSTGSSGQVCARNTAGTAYELITASGGDITDTDLDVATAANESTTAAPSRQAVAEAIYDYSLESLGYSVANDGDVTLNLVQQDSTLITATLSLALIDTTVFDSETATDGHVLTADGSGGSAWEAVTGGGGGGGSGGGYGDWESIGSATGAISGNPVTIALNSGETIDDYEELYIHIEANDTNDQRVVSPRFRVSDVPTTTLAGGGLGIPFAGNNTDEGAILVRRNADGDSLVLDAFGSVINFPTTAVTSIYARELTAGGGGGGSSTFLDLTDTPAAFGTAGQVPVVNAAGDGLVFEDAGGGGGGGDTTRTILLDGVTYSPGAARNFDFDSEIPARSILTFEIVGTATGYATMLSDDLLALAAQTGGPSTTANSYGMYTRNHSNSLPTQNQGNAWNVWREDADSIYFRDSRGSGGTLTITATPLGGGLSTSEQQELLDEVRPIDTDIITTPRDLAVYGTGTLFESIINNNFSMTEIPFEDLIHIDIGIELDSRFVVPVRITRQMILDTPTTPQTLFPTGGTTERRLACIYWSGRVSATQASEISQPVSRPRYSWANSRRLNGVEGIFIAITKNTDNDIGHISVYASSDIAVDIEYLTIRRYE